MTAGSRADLGEVVAAQQVITYGPSPGRVRSIVLLLAGSVALMMTGLGIIIPIFARRFEELGGGVQELGLMTMAFALGQLVAAPLMGSLADRYGRKKLLFAIAPLPYLANLVLIYAPVSGMGSSVSLLLYGLLFGFNSINMALASSMAAEIMPQEQMGRWIGVVGLFRGLLSIPAPLMGGLIWEHVGPQYVFYAAIAIDLCVRLPLLATIQETLHLSRE